MKQWRQTCKNCGFDFFKQRRVQPFCSISCHLDAKTIKYGPDDCWPWGGTKNSEGYGVISDNHKTLLAHRISHEVHNGPVEGLCVMHSCDNPPCVNPRHLSAGTQADNVADRVAKGRSRYIAPIIRGEKSHMSVLKEEDVVNIRQMAADGLPLREIAPRFPQVTRHAIWSIIARKNWKHIT